MSDFFYNVSFWLSQAYHSALEWIQTLDRTDAVALLVVVSVFGFLCMRGFGSRKDY